MIKGVPVGSKIVPNCDTGIARALNWGGADVVNAKYRIRSLRYCLVDAGNSMKTG